MNFDSSASRPTGIESVRLIGFGQAAARFINELRELAPEPLVPLLTDHPAWMEANGRRIGTDLKGLAFLFMVIGVDATEREVSDALTLAFRAQQDDVTTIGAFLHTERDGPDATPLQPLAEDSVSMPMLMDMVAGYVDVPCREWVDQLDALRWLATTLRRLHEEEIMVLEPAWDLYDLLETLDLPGASLKLLTRTVPVGEPATAAVGQALDDLIANGADLNLASGLLLVLWQSGKRRLKLSEVRAAGWTASQALGPGGQHMVLVARAGPDWDGVGACATVVCSWRRWIPDLDGEW